MKTILTCIPCMIAICALSLLAGIVGAIYTQHEDKWLTGAQTIAGICIAALGTRRILRLGVVGDNLPRVEITEIRIRYEQGRWHNMHRNKEFFRQMHDSDAQKIAFIMATFLAAYYFFAPTVVEELKAILFQ